MRREWRGLGAIDNRVWRWRMGLAVKPPFILRPAQDERLPAAAPSFPRKRESTPRLPTRQGPPGFWIPAYAGMTVGDGGMTVGMAGWRFPAGFPVGGGSPSPQPSPAGRGLWALCAGIDGDYIPEPLPPRHHSGGPRRHSRESGNPPPRPIDTLGLPGFWIPACAGMTVGGAGMTVGAGRP